MESKIVSVILKGFHGIMLFFSTHSQDPNGLVCSTQVGLSLGVNCWRFHKCIHSHMGGGGFTTYTLAQSLVLAPPIGALFDMDS